MISLNTSVLYSLANLQRMNLIINEILQSSRTWRMDLLQFIYIIILLKKPHWFCLKISNMKIVINLYAISKNPTWIKNVIECKKKKCLNLFMAQNLDALTLREWYWISLGLKVLNVVNLQNVCFNFEHTLIFSFQHSTNIIKFSKKFQSTSYIIFCQRWKNLNKINSSIYG